MREYQFRQFERNRYFPGKTLTVRDFKTEQEYFNQKRYMINRLIHGTGVLWGLQVEKIDGETVSIKPGMALDCFGREIIISEPVTMKISDVEGAPKRGIPGDKEVDFCVEYFDDEQEPVETTDRLNSCCKESIEYNRVKEKYRFKIKQKSDTEAHGLLHLLTKKNMFYKDNEVSITMATPAWVNPNELFPVRITVERKLQKSYRIDVKTILDKTLYFNDDNSKNIIIDMKSTDTNSVFTKDFYVRALPLSYSLTPAWDGIIRMEFSIKYLESNRESGGAGVIYLRIAETSISNEIVRSYFQNENQIIDTNDESVKLAGLELVKTRTDLGYNISQISKPGFGKYVYSNDMLYELMRNLETRLNNQKYPLEIKTTSASVKRPDPGSPPSASVLYRQMEKHLGFDFALPKEMATGIVYFDIESDILMAGDNGITEIIDPGLGKGPVYVNVQWEQCRYRETIVPKDNVVFGAYPNCTDGTFKIWYRVIRDFQRIEKNKVKLIHTLHFRWWAYTNVHDKGESRARRFVITPKHIRIKLKKDEAYTLNLNNLTAKFNNETAGGIVWGILPDKRSRIMPGFEIKNNKITFPAGTNSQSFVLRGKYQKENVYDKVIVTIINGEDD